MICLAAALPVSLLFPFLYFMTRDLHVAERTEDIGFYAGFVGASFMLGRCLISTVWGNSSRSHWEKTNCHVWHFLRGRI